MSIIHCAGPLNCFQTLIDAKRKLIWRERQPQNQASLSVVSPKDRKYLKASTDGSEDINFYFNRALDNERLGRYKEAIADYDLIAKIKTSEMDYHYENALFYRAWLKIKNKKNHKGAIEDMEKLIIMNPNNIDLKIDLATFYSKNNKNKKAVQILDKAIEDNPNEGNLYYWKGIYKNEYSYPSGCRYINKSKKNLKQQIGSLILGVIVNY